jgi:transposase
VKRGRTDAADAADAGAICEAVARPTTRFVPAKPAERQAAPLDHKARDLLLRQRTQVVNAVRAHLRGFGRLVAKGIRDVARPLDAARDVPGAARARPALDLLVGQPSDLEERVEGATAGIAAARKADPLARRLATIPGLGPIASLPLRRPHRTWRRPAPLGTMRRGSASRRGPVRRAARKSPAGSARRGTLRGLAWPHRGHGPPPPCGGGSTSAPWHASARGGVDGLPRPIPCRTGLTGCSRASR